ncbi:MAG: uroporphyrinogen-III C-methyltransferase [Pseudomonadales bacterium]
MSKEGDASGAPGAAADAAQPEPVGAVDPLGLDEDPGSAAEPPAARAGGRALAAFALLLALGAAAAAGYLYYELIQRGDDRVADRLEALETRLQGRLADLEQRLDARLTSLDERQRETLGAFAERQQGAQRTAEAALQTALTELANQGPPSSGEWQRAEVGYLLRIANHRLLMERDVAGALQLLRAADAILAEIDDFALHPVRVRLAEEITALERVRDVDLPGVFLRLESAKREIGRLPLQRPEYRAAAPAAAVAPAAEVSAETGVLAELQRQFAGLLRVRRLESDVKPLLAPEESLYLELNLRLMLERAQLAAMSREPRVFEESLGDAVDWIRRYFRLDDPAVRKLVDDLSALRALDLDQPLPDVSGSLNALQQVQRTPALDAP